MIDSLKIKEDIELLNKKIFKLLKKEPSLKDIKKYKIFHTFDLSLNNSRKFVKKNFFNKTFVKELRPNFFTERSLFKRKKYLHTQAFISDSLGNLVAGSDGRIIYCLTCKYISLFSKNEIELNRLFFEEKIDFAFYIFSTPICTYFAIKDEEIYVFKPSKKDELQMFTLEEFIDCCWDEFSIMNRP